MTAHYNDMVVSDREMRRCLEPEGNGVNPGRENGGGPSPPSREKDKLITSKGGDNSLMEQQEGR
jgi:hypothetical protein